MIKKDNSEATLRYRFRLSLLCVMLVGAVLLLRLFNLQIVQGTQYEKEAAGNRTREFPIAAVRGRILDSNGVELAYTRSAFAVSLLDLDNNNVQEVIPLLAEMLQLDPQELQEKMDANDKFSRMRPIRLTASISDAEQACIAENLEKLPGVYIDYVPVERIYPQGSLLSHVLGFVGMLDEADWANWAEAAGYTADELVGKQGLERAQESWLRGKPGRILVEIDAKNNMVRELSRIEPIPGNDIYITIDSEFQRYAEELLLKSLSTVRMQPRLDYRAAYAYS
ncbi:MAG: hypothetical protein FWF06_06800, partial [Symbiobacteriaceae bacterium]|nr:hypothetical protein [Symbiobacteriaceae bacterium]